LRSVPPQGDREGLGLTLTKGQERPARLAETAEVFVARHFPFLALLGALLASASAAHADYTSHADLICDPAKNIALARFKEEEDETAPAYARLPVKVDGGLSAQPGTGRRVCKLNNGWEIKLRNGQAQAYAYGMGGAAPPSFFSLWVDRRRLFSRQIWSTENYSETRTPIVALVITPQTVTICEMKSKSPACKTEKLDLDKHTVDAVEYPAIAKPIPRPGALEIVGGTNPANLCQGIITHGSRGGDMAGEPDVPIPAAQWDWIDTDESPGSEWAHVRDVRSVFGLAIEDDSGHYSFPSYPVDFDDDGKPDTVLAYGSDTHYFDGDFYIVAPASISIRDVIARIFGQKDIDLEKISEIVKSQGWHFYAGGSPGLYPDVSPRYVHLNRIEYLSKTLLLAEPTNWEKGPTSILIKPRADGTFETVCVFQRPGLHY
jgi:hypothetical protein